MTEADVLSFYEDKLDVWATNAIEGWADVMIHRDHLTKYLKLYPHKVTIHNVQAEINRSMEENNAAREAAVGKPYAFDYFPTYTEVVDWLREQAATYPDRARVVSLGSSYAGTDIQAIQLGTVGTAPLFFIHCTIHAREWITTTTCAYIIEQLLTVDTNLLQYYNWVIVPVLNVDGYAATHAGNRMWRKNRQPNSGSSCIGTDLNRNFAVGWSLPGASPQPCSDTYFGTSAFSGPEIDAERTFIAGWTTGLAAYVDIHAYGSMFMSPYGYTSSNPPDYSEMNRLMVSAVSAIRAINNRTYRHGTIYNVIYPASGGSNDWAYGDMQITPAYAIECYGTSFTAPVSQITPVAREVWAGVRAVAQNM
jgi:carboxypeptidase A2